MANAFIGLEFLRTAEEAFEESQVQYARKHLEIAVKAGKKILVFRIHSPHSDAKSFSDSSSPENLYLLSRVCMMLQDYKKVYQCLQDALSLKFRCPSIWLTVGTLYFRVNQYQDSFEALSRAVRLNHHLFEPWHNLGVLYDRCGKQPKDAAYAFINCLKRGPQLSDVQARLKALSAYDEDPNSQLLTDSLIEEMIDAPLHDQYYRLDEAVASEDDINFNPVREEYWEDDETDEDSWVEGDHTDSET
ncbi:hypothetical protein IL306_014479 [Fusarium sp. DS 682]|nr:hypothetical protein IL306_014479 [Fusarium sp. DS 682]